MTDRREQLEAVLGPRYRVERELSSGIVATVFVAEDLRHGRRVAIKVLSSELASSVDADRFRREIQIASRLSHPHILPVFDSGVGNGVMYYVMPFVEGESLRNRLERERQLPIAEAISITCEVTEALSYAHAFGVVHRDIKPENILLHGGHALLADFGIARIIQDTGGEKLTQTGMSVGTPEYMSPEQFSGETVDGRSDMYSLGCVLYEMLVGEAPFTGPNAIAIMARHMTELPPSIQIIRRAVPDELEGAIMHALEKVPADRFATGAQFEEALLGQGGTTTMYSRQAAPMARRSMRRRPENLVPRGRDLFRWLGRAERPHTEAEPPPIEANVYRVWFGTNRAIRPASPLPPWHRSYFGNTGPSKELHLGWCDVRIPRSHRIGSVGSSLWRRVISGVDDRLLIESINVQRSADFWSELRAILDGGDDAGHRATIFLHGYNVSFEEAARRAAQIGFDLQLTGPMCFFAWPSRGSLLGYAADAAAIESSEPAITEFLTSLALLEGVAQVDVIAHSMGNRGLLRAIQRILTNAETTSGMRFGHFILAAPDVDCQVFKDLAGLYNRVARQTTLYISDRDKALWLSRLLYRNPRAGFAPPVTVVNGIDTVHVANVDLTLLGHGYIAEARDVLHDMHELLTFGAAPSSRMGLRAVRNADGEPYWVIGA